VLGGIGPEATGIFYNRLIRMLQERKLVKRNKDYPQIFVNSIPAVELIHDNISDEDLKDYITGLKELEKVGADFIVMVCNTIHLFYDKLQKCVGTPILDLRDVLKAFLRNNRISKVTVLGTSSTIKKGLYSFGGISYMNPSDEEIERLTAAILNFDKGIERDKQAGIAKGICEDYLKKGSEIIILGCTEFAAMLEKDDFRKIDTIDLLVRATVEAFEMLRSKKYSQKGI